MFGNKPAQGSSTPQTANIGASIRIKGEIDSPEHVFLAGSLDGDITCDQLTVDGTGRVTGKISAKLAVIDGHVDGDIVVERLQIKSKAVVKGSLTYESIEVAEGAQIDGNFVQVTQKPQKDAVTLPKTEK
ncbi:MAG: bactofilin family protein [Candidatus Puniceispirillaceae bacterium]|jgi:cytoskeletal protein CcmA (bactofilin family)